MPTGFDFTLNPAFTVMEPADQRVPFVFNSPHSGRNYTSQFLSAIRLNRSSIRKSEDYRVDELFSGAVQQGCPMLVANFPRAFLDVNREPYELDPQMFDDKLPDFVNTRSARVAGGLGTIARIVSENEDIYNRKLTCEEGFERIETIYKPYHAALHEILTRTHDNFGYCVLVDCHSMPSVGTGGLRRTRPDIVLGDRYATSCAQKITWAAAKFLAKLGYCVEINKPYAGGFISEHYGRPDDGFHAIQIEINRGLYMNEKRLERSKRFSQVQEDMTRFIGRLVSVPDADLYAVRQLAAE